MKKIPEDLPFEERKARLLRSEAWIKTADLRKDNPKAAEEINTENINSKISEVGQQYGGWILTSAQVRSWVLPLSTSTTCRVFIEDRDVESPNPEMNSKDKSKAE